MCFKIFISFWPTTSLNLFSFTTFNFWSQGFLDSHLSKKKTTSILLHAHILPLTSECMHSLYSCSHKVTYHLFLTLIPLFLFLSLTTLPYLLSLTQGYLRSLSHNNFAHPLSLFFLPPLPYTLPNISLSLTPSVTRLGNLLHFG